MVLGFVVRSKILQSLGYPLPPPLVFERKSCFNIDHLYRVQLFIANLCIFVLTIQSMGDWPVGSKSILVNFIIGTGILSIFLIVMKGRSLYGGNLEKMSLTKYPNVLSQLLHSAVIFNVLCSLLFHASILSSLNHPQSYDVQERLGVLLAQACL
jgi:hypothetical protein